MLSRLRKEKLNYQPLKRCFFKLNFFGIMVKNILFGLTALLFLNFNTVSAQLNIIAENTTNAVPTPSNAIIATKNYMGVTLVGFQSKADKRAQRIEQAAKAEVVMPSTAHPIIIGANKLSEVVSILQEKYAAMLDILPVSLSNATLLENIDEWYGTRYRYGGTTKSGIDCSAFTRTMFKAVWGVELPRTAREQYGECRRISGTELNEGDLVFFNTTGGVSHVGIYLRNNKFIHASSSRGITISDIFDPYYSARFIGGGRIEKPDYMVKL